MTDSRFVSFLSAFKIQTKPKPTQRRGNRGGTSGLVGWFLCLFDIVGSLGFLFSEFFCRTKHPFVNAVNVCLSLSQAMKVLAIIGNYGLPGGLLHFLWKGGNGKCLNLLQGFFSRQMDFCLRFLMEEIDFF